MSRRPIARSPDLQRLRQDGYDLECKGAYLLIKDIPYANAQRQIKRGILISGLELADDATKKPETHVTYWTGEHPCLSTGAKMTSIENGSPAQSFGDGIQADFTFSAKADYRDYHHKMTTYIERISGEARMIDPSVTAMTHPVHLAGEEETLFNYIDTASARVNVGALNEKLARLRVAIVGLGGTGAYVLDFLAKTRIAEIHLCDGDVFEQHNAFRAPGAASIGDLRAHSTKVQYWARVYGEMRAGIVAHPRFLDSSNASELQGFDYVFLCMDSSQAKREIVAALEQMGTPFIETGMGVLRNDDQLRGLVRVVTSTPQTRNQARPHISFADGNGAENEYSTNIQIVELNALAASIAVIRFKKLVGFYADSCHDYRCGYSISANEIVAEGV